jgi:hypothetical protein
MSKGGGRWRQVWSGRKHALVRLFMLAILSALLVPVVLWYAVKPLRILAPQLNGTTCRGAICVEDPTQLSRAESLHRDAIAEVARKLSPMDSPPLTVFCSTRQCYRSFGGGAERGATLFDLGVILPPESWVPHIVEHEFIHMLQAQELGLVGRGLRPDWFIEGMPFLISEPPAYDLPDYAVPLVAQYLTWEQRVGRENVWREARKLRRDSVICCTRSSGPSLTY